MTPERWRVVTDLFHAALARTPPERAAFLAETCRDDVALQAEVEVLLEAHEATGSFAGVSALAAVSIPLAPGTALGPYVIERLIGAGGMGEVYRATDTRLERTVAIKILPTHRRSPELQARFEREARAISHLAHPHICTLHDVGHQDDTDYLVMEYLEGVTLEERLEHGAIPVEEALRIGTQVASALDHAHRQGIVHRDLKPANIVLTSGGSKLLDFGVARILASADVDSDPGRDTTRLVTASGIRPGTLQYMSPEQLENGTADARSDIWALGCVLYEMFGGRKPFAGDTRTAVADAIVHARPAPLGLGHAGLAALEHIVMTCIAKSPEERWQSAADIGRQLQWIGRQEPSIVVAASGAAPPPAAGRIHRYSVLLLLLALLSAAMSVAVWRWTSPRPQSEHGPPVLSLAVTFTENDPLIEPGGLAISPDGQTIVYAGRAKDGQRLYIRRLRESEVRPIPFTDGAMAPFFSPDGKWVGFVVVARGILKVPIDGGPAHQICDCGGAVHATWADDRIVFSSTIGQPGPGLWVVSANGGAHEPLLRPPGGAKAYLSPEVLPGGKVVLFTIREAGRTDVAALHLETNKIDVLIPGGSRARYLPTRYLIYLSAGALVAEGFDVDRLARRHDARTLVTGVGDDQTPGNGPFAVSQVGTLGYIPMGLVAKRLVWVDRSGKRTPLDLPARSYVDVEISPDGRQLAMTIMQGPARNIWRADTSGGPLTQLTFGNDDMYGVFSASGKDVLYTRGAGGRYNVFSIPADGSGEPRPLTHSTHSQRVTAVTRDGRTALLTDIDPETSLDLLQIDLRRTGAPTTVRRTPQRELGARLSPDDRWIAYASDEAKELTIHVQPFPGPVSGRQVSPGRGVSPHWHPTGKELFYQTDDAIYAIPIREGRPAGPAKRFLPHTTSPGSLAADWTVGPDGRVLLIDRAASGSFQIPLLLNLLNDLKETSTAPQRKRE